VNADQANLRELCESILHVPPADVRRVLSTWKRSHGDAERDWLAEFADRRTATIPPATPEQLARLYAFSRVNDLLLLAFQPTENPDAFRPELPADEYLAFMTFLGFRPARASQFSPFFHEVVLVSQSTRDDEPISVVETLSPCLMLGDMMFSRAGCAVRGGRDHVVKAVAERSTLYWAWRRNNRPCEDLSMGWGSNSQWRTDFRRDYLSGGRFHFNVDGRYDATRPEDRSPWNTDPLPTDQRIELLTHRCFVRTDCAHDDLCPYGDRLVTPADAEVIEH
jgi:hypothetical protein